MNTVFRNIFSSFVYILCFSSVWMSFAPMSSYADELSTKTIKIGDGEYLKAVASETALANLDVRMDNNILRLSIKDTSIEKYASNGRIYFEIQLNKLKHLKLRGAPALKITPLSSDRFISLW